ncbi:peptidoglycan-binding protein [Streptomyces sp. V3I8]|uniref:peptidoglycan-binding domain-containing protein n=1 Tax=Streptomyces sp. V3I8 TaxID=3042279 RepID=UPI0027D82979|nr:peptidoglycan-binding domain-containing protein [Streptomyces sp. V3I8]
MDLSVTPEGSGTTDGTAAPGTAGVGAEGVGAEGVGAEGATVPIPSIPVQRSTSAEAPTAASGQMSSADSRPRPLSDATTPLSRATVPPHPANVQLFGDGSPPSPPDLDGPGGLEGPDGNTSRRRRFALVGAGATAVVVAAAGFASGLFSYESPSRGSAAPDDIRASVPDTSVEEPSPSESGSPSASSSPSASASASAGESTEPEASGSPTASATASSRASATTDAPSAENPTSTTKPSATPTDRVEPVVLRRGDKGPEVVELQSRLKQLAMYVGEANGDYDNRTENAVRSYQLTRGIQDGQGVYTEQTRQRLESETSEP